LEIVARYYFAWVCQQEQEDLEGLVAEFNLILTPCLRSSPVVRVDFECTKSDRAAIPGHTRSSQIEYTSLFTRLAKALDSDGLAGNSKGSQKAPPVD